MVAMKNFKSYASIRDKALIAKEASLLSKIKHQNIIKVLGVCEQPVAIMLELCQFSFKPFQSEKVCSNLKQFLEYLHETGTFTRFIPKIGNFIAKDLSSAIQFLHEKDMVHRDIKPENCLVSNIHYSSTNVANMEEVLKNPITLKLGDLGESRSALIRTRALQSTMGSKTKNINRGTPTYMAPELLTAESKLKSANIDQLKKADIWSMVMTFFMVINPDQEMPFENESIDCKEDIIALMEEKKKPYPNSTYLETQATQYQMLLNIIQKYLDFDPSGRGTASQIYNLIIKEFGAEFLIMPLEISQSSAITVNDEKFAMQVAFDGCNVQLDMLPKNDGTNGCAFLALGIIDRLADASINEDSVPSVVESVIREFPLKFNNYRDISKLYDTHEALDILKRNALLTHELEFVEEILEKHPIYTSKSSQHLIKELLKLEGLAKQDNCRQFGIFTGGIIITALSVSPNGMYTAMDTHPVSEKDKGDGNGVIVMSSSPFKLVEWLLGRADSGGAEEKRPFIMKVNTRFQAINTANSDMSSPASNEEHFLDTSFDGDNDLIDEASSPIIDISDDEINDFSDDGNVNESCDNLYSSNYSLTNKVMTQMRWRNIIEESVEQVPFNIDGEKHYVVKSNERRVLLAMAKDGRKWGKTQKQTGRDLNLLGYGTARAVLFVPIYRAILD